MCSYIYVARQHIHYAAFFFFDIYNLFYDLLIMHFDIISVACKYCYLYCFEFHCIGCLDWSKFSNMETQYLWYYMFSTTILKHNCIKRIRCYLCDFMQLWLSQLLQKKIITGISLLYITCVCIESPIRFPQRLKKFSVFCAHEFDLNLHRYMISVIWRECI